MPYKCESMKLSENQDRRRKLTEEQKEKIKKLYQQGKGSQQALADKYHVSKSCIAIIVNPKRAANVKARSKEHWKDYADSKKHKEAIKNLRHYKYNLYLDEKLK